MNSNLPLVSVVCAVGVDEGALADFHGNLYRVLRALEVSYRFEVLFVGDDRRAAALKRAEALAQLDARVRVLPQTQLVEGEGALRAGLEEARGDLVITLDPLTHSPQAIPHLLEQARGACDIVLAAAAEPPRPTWLTRFRPSSHPLSEAALLLLKRPAADALRALRDNPRSLRDLAIATGLPRADVTCTPCVGGSARKTGFVRRCVADGWAVWRRDPLHLVTWFGATVFLLGVFLACWFTLQGLIVPDRVWFSWGYLIVLLHILGGSTLFALGKVGSLAQRILERVEASPAPQAGAANQQAPLFQARNAA